MCTNPVYPAAETEIWYMLISHGFQLFIQPTSPNCNDEFLGHAVITWGSPGAGIAGEDVIGVWFAQIYLQKAKILARLKTQWTANLVTRSKSI